MLTPIAQLFRVIRVFTRRSMAFEPQRPDADESVWTPEEQADYAQWLREFAKPSVEREPDEWLDWAEAEFTWDRPVPSC